MKYKAIISDIDGTVTAQIVTGRYQPLPSKKTVQAIQSAQSKIVFVLATSRPLARTTYLLDYLKLNSPCITLNGALIVNAKTREILQENAIPLDDLYKVAQYLKKKKYSFVIDEIDKVGNKFTKKYLPNNPLNLFVSELSDEQANQVEKDLSKISTIALHKLTSWTPTLWGFNISNAQVSKQHAILEVAKILNILPEEMIGIGDGYNDFPLLMACGLKVAMGNAVPELKAIADYIAPSLEEDGVAEVIKRFVLDEHK